MKGMILLRERKANVRLEQFVGEWVALVENKVIAHSKTLDELMKNIGKHPLKKKISIFLVPREENPYILPFIISFAEKFKKVTVGSV